MRQLGQMDAQLRETANNLTRDYNTDIREITGEITALQNEIRGIQRDLGNIATGFMTTTLPPAGSNAAAPADSIEPERSASSRSIVQSLTDDISEPARRHLPPQPPLSPTPVIRTRYERHAQRQDHAYHGAPARSAQRVDQVRHRAGITTTISLVFTTQILQFLIAPYGGILETIDPTENVTTYFRVALMSGAVLAMPFLVYFVWSFIAPGLEDKEKRYVRFHRSGRNRPVRAGRGLCLGHHAAGCHRFLSQLRAGIFKTSWRAAAYIPFVTALMFWIGVAFELPLIIFFLAKLKIVTAKKLLSWWRFAVVGSAIVAALITPTIDPFNMALVMGPLIILYFLSVLLAKLAR